MKITLPQKPNLRQSLFIALTTAIVIIVSFAVINKYEESKSIDSQKRAEAKAQQIEMEKVVTQHDLDKQASISRLVSICLNAQQAYDAGTPKAKAGSIRPDCTVVE